MPLVPGAFDGPRVRAEGLVESRIPSGAFGGQIASALAENPVPAAMAQTARATAQSAQGLEEFAAGLAKRAEQQVRLRSTAEAENGVSTFTSLLAEERTRRERDPAFQVETYQEGGQTRVRTAFDLSSEEIRRQVEGTLTTPQARAAFNSDALRMLARERAEVLRAAYTKGDQQARAQTDVVLDREAQAFIGARDDGERQRATANAMGAITVREQAGVFNAEQAEKLRQSFRAKVQSAQVMRTVLSNPAQAMAILSDTARTPDIPEERRASLMGNALSAMNAAASRAAAAETRALRVQNQAGNRALNEWMGRLDAARQGERGPDGQPIAAPTRQDLDRVRDFLSPGEYRAALTTLRDAPAARDDPATIADLQPRVHAEAPADFTRRAGLALEERRITTGTYRGLLQQNEAARRDDAPASAYRSGRTYINDALNPEGVVGGQFIQGPLRQARQNALVDFDRWARENPTAGPDASIQAARDLSSRYQMGASAESRLSLPRPYGFTGDRSAVTPQTLQAAAAAVTQAVAAGRLTRAEAVREAESLQGWQTIFTREPPPAARTPTPSGRGTGPRPPQPQARTP